jgi:hypothetical protein
MASAGLIEKGGDVTGAPCAAGTIPFTPLTVALPFYVRVSQPLGFIALADISC